MDLVDSCGASVKSMEAEQRAATPRAVMKRQDSVGKRVSASKTKPTYSFAIGSKLHEVVVDLSKLSGKRTLTVDGERQARAAAAVLASGARDRAGSAIPKFDRIYASPCARTLATARELSASLGDLPVTVVPALAACAAAVKRRGLKATPFLADAAAVALCPALEGVAHDAPDEFDTACAWLARTSPTPVLVVSHREGIRDLAHERLKLPYCAIAAFEIRNATRRRPLKWC